MRIGILGSGLMGGKLGSEVLFSVFENRGGDTRPTLVYCGDDAGAKQVAAQLNGKRRS